MNVFFRFIVLATLCAKGAGMDSAVGSDAHPLACWPLASDARDTSGNGRDGRCTNASFDGRCAAFDGSGAFVEAPALDLGLKDFTIALWLRVDGAEGDAPGDLVTMYDPATRRGFNLSLLTLQGVASGSPNRRNLHFGIDDGAEPAAWADCGRPGDATMVWAFCVHEGRLYAGTFEAGEEQAGHVYRYESGTNWTDCGSPHPCNTVTALVSFGGQLYAGASHYRAAGSALAESENVTSGGRVFRYAGGKDWVDCGKLGESEAVGGLAVFDGALYASSMYAPPGLYRYDGGTVWADCGNPEGRVEALTVYRGCLYGSGWDQGRSGMYRFDGNGKWTDCGTPPDTTQTYSFAAHLGELYAGVWPGGKVCRYRGGQDWEDCGRLGEELEVMGMCVYNGKLYAGTLPLAAVYRYDGPGQWGFIRQLDTTPDVKYRRAWTMGIFDGKLFCGTLPSGRVFAFEAGRNVTLDTALGESWRHVAAIRNGGSLALYVDGEPVARSVAEKPLDISTTAPVRIGFGAQDYFRGAMRDIRVYGKALDDRAIESLVSDK